MKETRKERFNRLATYRTNEVIDKIRILGNCSNKSTYEYTESDINKIFRAIEIELRETKKRFSSTKSKFTL